MNVLKSKYYSNTKFFLELHGLWPYQTATRRWISHILYYLITCSALIPLTCYIVLRNPDFEIFANNLSLILYIFTSQLKYSVSFISASQLKILLSQIKHDWKEIKDTQELNILKNTAEKSRLISLLYISYVLSGVIIGTGPPLLLSILKANFPLKNGSYPDYALAVGEYVLFDQVDHPVLTDLHFFIGNFLVNSMFAGTDTIYLSTVQHVSGLFDIVSYRMKNIGRSEDDSVNVDALKSSVELYNKCVRCCGVLEDSFSICILIILVLCPLGIGAIFYRFYIFDDIYQRAVTIILALGILIQMFYLNWVGQQITNSSDKVFNSVYFSNWYVMPPKKRKAIVIIMSRMLNPCKLTAGKMIVLSMHTFGAMMRTCTSIFAVIAVFHRKY